MKCVGYEDFIQEVIMSINSLCRMNDALVHTEHSDCSKEICQNNQEKILAVEIGE